MKPDKESLEVATLVEGATETRRSTRLRLTPEFLAVYDLGEKLGAGSYGTVFAAVAVATGRKVAVKVLMDATNAEQNERFQREARVLRAIEHPNVVRVLDVGTVSGHPYIVTELLEGPTLRALLRKKEKLPVEEALALARDVLAGLEGCHQVGVVHRDLKPANIMFDAQRRARLLDLGLAGLTSSSEHLTRAGTMLGTPKYMAPELAMGGTVDGRADLYALGCILFEAIAGKHPYDVKGVAELLRAHTKAPVPLLAESAKNVPRAVSEAIYCAMSKDPAGRPRTATAFLADLEGRGPKRVSSVVPVPVKKKSRSKRALVAGSMALIALGALAVLLGPRRGPVQQKVDGSAVPRSPRAWTEVVPPAIKGPRVAALQDGGAALPPGALGRLGSFWTSHPGATLVAVSASARWLVTARPGGTVRVWDQSVQRLAHAWHEPDGVQSIQVSDAGPTVLVEARRDSLDPDPQERALIRLDRPIEKRRTVLPPAPAGAVRSQDGLVEASLDRTRREIQVTRLDGAGPAVRIAFAAPGAALALDGTGRRLVAAAGKSLTIWDLPETRAARTLALDQSVDAIHLSRDGKRAAAELARAVEVLDLASGAKLLKLDALSHQRVAIGHDGSQLFRSGGHGYFKPAFFETVNVGSARSVEVNASLSDFAVGGQNQVFAVNDGRFGVLATGTPGTPQTPGQWPPGARNQQVEWLARGGERALVRTADGELSAWDRRTGKLVRIAPGNEQPVGVTPDQRTMLFRPRPAHAPGDDDVLVHYDPRPRELRTVDLLSGDGQVLPARPRDGVGIPLVVGGRHFDTISRTERRMVGPGRLLGRPASAETPRMGFMEAADFAVWSAADRSQSTALVTFESGRAERRDLKGGSTRVLAESGWKIAALDESRRAAVYWSVGQPCILARIADAARVRELDLPDKQLVDLAISPDGRLAAAGYADGSAAWCDLATGRREGMTEATYTGLTTVAIDAEDSLLFLVGGEGVLTVFDLAALPAAAPGARTK